MKTISTHLAIHTSMLASLALFGLTTRATAADAQPRKHVAVSQAAVDTDDGGGKKEPLDCEWLPFPDDAKFKLLGLPWFKENSPKLWRMPKGRFDALTTGVKNRCKAPAGGRILIRCNSTKLGLKVTPSNKGNRKGFDVYINGEFLRSVVAEEPNKEAELALFASLDNKEKEIVIYLPNQQEVTIAAIGVDKGTKFSPPEHKFARPLPVVFYGSSVCQGSGASRPGMTYEGILCRELNLDYVSLGFGGAGKAEPAVVDLVNSIPACCYVFDLGKSYGMQDATAYKNMVQAVRKSHPDVPILCLTPITSTREVRDESYSKKSIHTRTVMRDPVNELIKAGDKRLFLIEGEDLLGFNEHDGLSKDGVHPSDQGYGRIAKKLLPTVKKALGL